MTSGKGAISHDDLRKLVSEARARLLQMHISAGVGHAGGNLSCLEIVMTLFHSVMRDEDKFVLSKGHAAGMLYVALNSIGKLSDKQLTTFHGEPTLLPGHPAWNTLPG